MYPAAPARLQLSRRAGYRKPEAAVVVARPGRYGNPFTLAQCYRSLDAHTPAQQARLRTHCAGCCVELYEQSLKQRWQNDPAELAAWLAPLWNRPLACWCAPGSPCHAEVLLRYANNPYLMWHRYDALARLDVVDAAQSAEHEALRDWLTEAGVVSVSEVF